MKSSKHDVKIANKTVKTNYSLFSRVNDKLLSHVIYKVLCNYCEYFFWSKIVWQMHSNKVLQLNAVKAISPIIVDVLVSPKDGFPSLPNTPNTVHISNRHFGSTSKVTTFSAPMLAKVTPSRNLSIHIARSFSLTGSKRS